jgi:hypothetical protein
MEDEIHLIHLEIVVGEKKVYRRNELVIRVLVGVDV